MTIIKVLLGLAAWALACGVIAVFMSSASRGRQRVEGGRPEDRA